jgi:3-oxoacyl-[acyl-carrier protein] reductase
MNTLNGKIAIVTGASKGIGAAIAEGLGAAGAAVVVNYGGDKDNASRVVKRIIDSGGRAVAIQGDIAKKSDVENLFSEANKALGTVDVLVNNAGVFTPTPLEGATAEEFHRHFNLNVLGTIMAIQEFARQAGDTGGSIVNITSAGVENPGPYSTIPIAAKAAVVALTKVLAKELGPRKIRVNSIGPGAIDTDGLRKIGITDNVIKQVVDNTPLGRIGQPKDLAPIVAFLASADAGWVTGEHILASGGSR